LSSDVTNWIPGTTLLTEPVIVCDEQIDLRLSGARELNGVTGGRIDSLSLLHASVVFSKDQNDVHQVPRLQVVP
jgi:hypothetical protein